MPRASGEPTLTELQHTMSLELQANTIEITHVKEGMVRIELAVDRNLTTVTKSIQGFSTKLDTALAQQGADNLRHNEAEKDRMRMWSFIKAQWGATGIGSMLAAAIGYFFGK